MAQSDRLLTPALLEGVAAEAIPHRSSLEVADLDMLYMAGFPEGHGETRVGEELRSRFCLMAAKPPAPPHGCGGRPP